jgi:3-dehydroquinate dehydratase-2
VATKSEALRIAIVHGPNLNLLGQREPDLYGLVTLADIDTSLQAAAQSLGASVRTYQSNREGDLVDHIQQVAGEVDGFIVNAAAYTHTSVAIRDALLSVGKPYVEVHLSNVHAREGYRHHSYLSDRAVGVVVGFGPDSYLLGLRGMVNFLRRRKAGSPSAPANESKS